MNWKHIVLLLICVSCSDLEKLEFNEKNPTIFTYSYSIDRVKSTILDQFKDYNYRKMGLYFKENFYPDSLSIFTQIGNENDFCLSTYDDPIGKSYLYLKNGRPLDYIASFHLHLVVIDSSQTKIEVRTLKSKVVDGLNLLPNVHGVRSFKYQKVDPSTIEEYEILLRIGAALGQKEMPRLKEPKKE